MTVFSRIYLSLSYRVKAQCWNLYQRLKSTYLLLAKDSPRKQIFIFGCQRSGTTHLERLFRADPRSVVFGEFSELSISNNSTSWRALDDIEKLFYAGHGDYVVARSLLASHRALDVIKKFPEATIIWMFREPTCVVDSMIRKWGGDFKEISEKVEVDSNGEWELRPLWNQIERELDTYSPNSDPKQRILDLYGLYWFHRNSLFFDLDMKASPQVIAWDYDRFSKNSKIHIANAFEKIGVKAKIFCYPLKTRKSINDSMDKIKFSPEIASLCEQLYRQLLANSAMELNS